MSNFGLLSQSASTINIQVSVLVWYKADIIIIPLKLINLFSLARWWSYNGTGSSRPESRSPPESFRPESRSPPESFRPYSRSPRVVSPRFINSALKNEIWKIPF